jgi:hypothetical protein
VSPPVPVRSQPHAVDWHVLPPVRQSGSELGATVKRVGGGRRARNAVTGATGAARLTLAVEWQIDVNFSWPPSTILRMVTRMSLPSSPAWGCGARPQPRSIRIFESLRPSLGYQGTFSARSWLNCWWLCRCLGFRGFFRTCANGLNAQAYDVWASSEIV